MEWNAPLRCILGVDAERIKRYACEGLNFALQNPHLLSDVFRLTVAYPMLAFPCFFRQGRLIDWSLSVIAFTHNRNSERMKGKLMLVSKK